MSDYQLRNVPTNKDLKDLLTFSPLLQQLLFHRGIHTKEDAQKFLEIDYRSQLHDPFLLPGMKDATERLEAAIKNKEKIAIYADYDADGIPGAVILHDFFKKISYERFVVYIPHRNKEGFGLNTKAIDELKKQDVDLIITIDCGTADIEEVAYVKELGMDIIITDHHKENEKLPDAIVVNHKISSSQYPEQVLCGSGVIFKVVQAMITLDEFSEFKGQEKWLLDMVGIATLSDMVPLTGENRVLAHYGMIVLKKTRRKGIHHLLKVNRTKLSSLTETDIGFTITPRINAASRMGKPIDAFAMLTADTDDSAANAVQNLELLNSERKGHVASITKKAKQKIKNIKQDTTHVVVVGDPEWQPSLLGLVANALAEEYKCPAFVWGRGDGKELKGSCRTGNNLSLHAILQGADTMFDAAGGHDEAGGFVLKRDCVDVLHEALAKEAEKLSTSLEQVKKYIDLEIPLSDLHTTYTETRKLAPFGIGNEEPVFLFKDVLLTDVQMFGKQKNHFKCVCKGEGGYVEAIAFFKDESSFTATPEINKKVSIVGTLERSEWGYKPQLRIRLIDII